jgi:hypothetical protein
LARSQRGRPVALAVRKRRVGVVAGKMHPLRYAPRGRIALEGMPPIVKHFADAGRVVAVLHEMLRQGDQIGMDITKVGRQVPDSQRVRTQAGQHRSARGIAQRLLAIRAVEQHAALGKPVQMRRLG